MNPDSASDEIRDLMLRHLEGAVSPEESRLLDLLLRNSPAAQHEYAELLVQVVQLRSLGQEQIVPPLRQIEPAHVGFWQSAGPRWLAAAACFIALAAWFFFSREPQVEPGERLAGETEDMAAADAVATLTSGAGLVWESGANAQFEVGEPIEPG